MRLTFVLLAALLLAPSAQAREGRVPPDVFKAVRHYWHSSLERRKAFDVVSCETGGRYNTTARNGQYENIFQMGYVERKTYGWHVAGDPAWKAAWSAHRLWRVRGWSPWSCA